MSSTWWRAAALSCMDQSGGVTVSQNQPEKCYNIKPKILGFSCLTETLKVWNMWRTWLKCGMSHRLSRVFPSAENSCCSSSICCCEFLTIEDSNVLQLVLFCVVIK